jgi:hypothetical protein
MTRPRRWRWWGKWVAVATFALLWLYLVLTARIVAPLVMAAAAAFLWTRRNLDRAPDSCPYCRYDLSGTPPPLPCPECGRAQQSAEAAETTTR